MRKFTVPVAGAALFAAGLAGAAHADPISCPGSWSGCALRGGVAVTGDAPAPVGSLTYYLTALIDDADGSVVRAD